MAAVLLALSVPVALPATESDLVDSLGQNDLQEAFRVLREDSLARSQLSDLTVNRAALAGLLGILGPGAELLPASSDETSSAHTNLIASLPGGIAYVRSANPDDTLLAGLVDLPDSESGLVLDLRCPGGELDPALASRLAAVFCPPSAPHFSLVDPAEVEIETFIQDPAPRPRQGRIVLLVDSHTNPTSETAAAIIRIHNRGNCLIIGEATPGRAAVYETHPLGKKARLRFAKAGVRLPDGTNLFQQGLVPDILVAAQPESKNYLLSLIDQKLLAEYITEKERPVLNEAALMAGTNPSLPALLNPETAEAETEARPLLDPALRQALDFLTTRAFLESAP